MKKYIEPKVDVISQDLDVIVMSGGDSFVDDQFNPGTQPIFINSTLMIDKIL